MVTNVIKIFTLDWYKYGGVRTQSREQAFSVDSGCSINHCYTDLHMVFQS